MKKLLLLLVIICFSNVCVQAATDNVLQSIQIDTFKDTYNIILKSDEKPEAKRVINDENKIMLYSHDMSLILIRRVCLNAHKNPVLASVMN